MKKVWKTEENSEKSRKFHKILRSSNKEIKKKQKKLRKIKNPTKEKFSKENSQLSLKTFAISCRKLLTYQMKQEVCFHTNEK